MPPLLVQPEAAAQREAGMREDETCCNAVVLAVNGRDDGDFAAAFGEVEALLGGERGEELCASFLEHLHDNIRGLVEGGREWEEDVSSSKLAVLFRLLHQLVRLLSKTGQRLPGVGAGSGGGGGAGGPFEPFATCAVKLAEAQVDVGRRMDLTGSVTGFLRALGLYDSQFRARLVDAAFHARSDA